MRTLHSFLLGLRTESVDIDCAFVCGVAAAPKGRDHCLDCEPASCAIVVVLHFQRAAASPDATCMLPAPYMNTRALALCRCVVGSLSSMTRRMTV
jgi:hypothetical protein